MLNGCTYGTNTSSRVCPKPIIISEKTQAVLKSEVNDFYIKFTNQQLDLAEADDE